MPNPIAPTKNPLAALSKASSIQPDEPTRSQITLGMMPFGPGGFMKGTATTTPTILQDLGEHLKYSALNAGMQGAKKYWNWATAQDENNAIAPSPGILDRLVRYLIPGASNAGQ